MRYIPVLPHEREEMLRKIGKPSVQSLFERIPEELRLKGKIDLPKRLSELELVRFFEELFAKNKKPGSNKKWNSFLGAGAYDHYIPAAVDHITSRTEFYTAYTPYQPELAQGTLQSIFEFQSMIASISGMELSNASMYDGASAMAEAILMAERITKKNKFLVASTVHPEYKDVTKTYTLQKELKFVEIPVGSSGQADYKAVAKEEEIGAVIVQYPNFFGVIEDLKGARKLADDKKALLIVVSVEPLSLGVLKAPGDFGCDIFVAEGQSFGNYMSFGGPHLGIMATKKAYIRNMPGRIVSQTVDSEGKTGYVLYLSTREQHIRREKATSNICTNNALCALRALIHLSLLGEHGFKAIAGKNLSNAQYLKEKLKGIRGVRIKYESPIFNEFVFETSAPANSVLKKLEEDGIVGGIALSKYYKGLDTSILVSVTETKTKKDLDSYVEAVKKSM
jgi:glycine dehydrogenase subunit 1